MDFNALIQSSSSDQRSGAEGGAVGGGLPADQGAEPAKMNYIEDHQLREIDDSALPPINSFMRPSSASSSSSAYPATVASTTSSSNPAHAVPPPYQGQYPGQLSYTSYNPNYQHQEHQLYDLDKNYQTPAAAATLPLSSSSAQYSHLMGAHHLAESAVPYMNPSLKYMGHSGYHHHHPQLPYNAAGSMNPNEYAYSTPHYGHYSNHPYTPMNPAQAAVPLVYQPAPPVQAPSLEQLKDPTIDPKNSTSAKPSSSEKKPSELGGGKTIKEGKKSASSSARYICDLCDGKEFVTLPVISKHIRQHSLVLCNLCVKTFVTTDEMKSHECRPRGSNANYPKCPICLKYLSNTWSLSRHMKTHKRDGSAGGGKLDGSKSGSDDGSKTGFGEEDSKGFEKSGGDTTGEEGGPDDDDHHSNQMMHHHPEFVLKNPRVILEKLSLTQLQGELHNHQLHQQSNRLVADERTKSSEDLSLGEEASGGGNLASGFSSEECDKNGDSFGIAEQQGVGSTAVAMMEKCQVCGKEFKNRTYLYKHLKSVHTAKVMKPSLGSDEGGCSSGAGNGDDMQLEKDPLDNAPVRPDTAKALASKFNKKFNGKMDSPTGGGPSGHIMDNNNNNNGSGADYLVPLSNSNPNQININTSGNSITIISNVTYCNTQHDVPINAGGMMGSGGDGKGDPILDRRMTDPKYDMLGQMQYGPLDPMNQKPLEMAKYDDVDPNQQKMLEPTPFVIQKLKKEVVVHSMENQYGEPSGSFSDEKLSSAQMEMKPLVDPLLESYSIKKEEHNPEEETAVMDSKKIFNFHDMEMLKSNIKEEEMGNEHKYEPSDYSQQTMSSPVKSKDMLLGFDDHPDLGDEDHESNSKPDMSLDMKCENLEEKAHPCDECGKCFAKRSQLTRHKNIHKNIIYICPFCQREPFKARNSLKNHLKTNHKEMNDKWGDPAYISAQVIKDPEKVEEYLKNWNERTKPNVNGSNSSKPGPSKSSAISPAIENPADLKMNLGAHNLSSSYEKAIPIDHGNIIPGMPAGHGSGSKKKKKGSKQEANIGENYTIPELDNDLSVGIKGVVKQEFEAGTAPVGGSTSGGYYQYGGCNPAGFNSYQTQPSAYGSMASHSEYGNYQQQPSHTGIPASTSALPFQGYPSSTANYTQNGPYQQHSVPSAAPPQPPPAQQSQHQYAQSNPSPAARTPGNINNPMSPPISPHLQQQQAAQDFYSDQGATSSRGSNPGRVNYSSSAASAYHHQHQYYMQNLNHHSPDNNSYPYPANPQIQSSYAHSHGHSSFPGGNSSASNSSTAPHPYHSSSQSHTIPPTPPPSASSFSSSSSSHHPAKPLVGMPPSVPSLHQHHHNYGQYESVSASKRPRIDRYYPPNQPLPPASYPMEQAMGQYQHHQYLQSSGSSSGGSSGPSSSGPGGSTPSGYMGPPAPQ